MERLATVAEAEAWILEALRDDDCLYIRPRGYEQSVRLYATRLSGGFLATLIDGREASARFGVPASEFAYPGLLRALARLTESEACFWFYVTDPDNALSLLQWTLPNNPGSTSDQHLKAFEQTPARQGGCSHLGLLAAGARWLLWHSHIPDEEFEITFHASRPLCQALLAALGLHPQAA